MRQLLLRLWHWLRAEDRATDQMYRSADDHVGGD